MPKSANVILTRPLAQSRELAEKLLALGYAVDMFPLLEIAGLPKSGELYRQLQSVLDNLQRYAMAAFVSPNAIHAVFADGLQWPSEVAIAVMGEGSRSTLAEYGINDSNTRIFSPTDSFRSDSETLLENLDLAALRGRSVVIFRSETGRELLADALIKEGVGVDKIIAYQRLIPTLTAEHVKQLGALMAGSGIWVVSSSEALRTLENMVTHLAGENPGADAVVKLHQVNLWVSHHRIAQIAEKSGFKRVQLIGSGDENLLLALQSRP